MNNRYKIKFTLDGTIVNPGWGQEVEKTYERDADRMLYRERLNGNLVWARGDEKKIRYQDLEHEFELLIERLLDTGLYETYINGIFNKTDIAFNEDRGIHRGPVRSIDKYEKVIGAMDREFDLLDDLKAPPFTVQYKKQPLLQLFFPGHPKLFNMIGKTFWIADIPDYQETDVESFGFATPSDRYLFVPGSGDMTPDVSGFYQPDVPVGIEIERWTRLDGDYRIVGFGPLGVPHAGQYRWRIVRTLDNEDVYSTGYVDLTSSNSLFPTEDFTFNGSYTFNAIVNPSTNKCRAFAVSCFQRLLTDLETVNGNPTISIPQPDVADIVFGYSYYVDPIDYPELFAVTQAEEPHTDSSTSFGKYVADALHWAGQYFNPDMTIGPLGATDAFPLFNDSWREYSIKMYRGTFGINAYQTGLMTQAATPVTNSHCYKLGETIKLLLEKIDTSIDFDLTPEYSELLFSDTNPVTGDPNYTHFITPKTNVLVSNFDNAATRAPITLGQTDNLLKFGLNAFWFIDSSRRFRIEHISWFKNGGTYNGQVISIDLTTHIVPQLQRPWAYHTKEYRYKKEILPEMVTYGWMDEVSQPFKGFPIEMLSSFVQKGNIPDNKIVSFTSDIDYIQAVPDQVSKDGFVVLAASVSDNVWTVAFDNITINGLPDQYIQNGFWSFYYLHDKFHRHNLPAKRVKINGVQSVATTTRRAKELELTFPAGIEPPPMELLVTSLGIAEIDSMSINMNTRKATLKVLLDLDFDNPCPCEGYFREASYLMPISADENNLDDLLIASVLINGDEYLTEAVPIVFEPSVVDIGGNDWVTNLADAINALGIPNLSSPYPEAGDFANGMTDTSRICRLRFPECFDVQITITRNPDDGLSVRWEEDGHFYLDDDGETWVDADTLAPDNSFVWDDQPRLAQIFVPCL